jgi:hypothetical protein
MMSGLGRARRQKGARVNTQIVSNPYVSVAAPRAVDSPTPDADGAAQDLPGPADSSQAAQPLASTPAQFSTSMMDALLNLQAGVHAAPTGTNSMNPGQPVTLINGPVLWSPGGGVPGGVALNGLDAGDAAQEITNTVGSSGTLSLSDVETFMGVGGSDEGSQAVAATISKDWSSWTGSSAGTLDTGELTDAIQKLIANQPTA